MKDDVLSHDDLQRRLGRSLATYRKARSFTQEGLAELVDTSPEWISQVERGIGNPSLTFLFRVAEALGTTTGALFAHLDEDNPARPEVQRLLALAADLPDAQVRVLVAAAGAMADAQREAAESP